MNNLFLFNLSNYEIPLNVVMKLWKQNINIEDINNLSLEDFMNKYIIKKKDIAEKIKGLYKEITTNPLSVYALASNGLSERIIDIILSKNIKYIFEFHLLSNDYLNELGLTDSIISKIRLALNLDYIIDYNDETIKNYIKDLENNSIYIEILEKKILKELNEDYISDSELLDKLDDCYKKGHIYDKAINNLINKEYIEASLFGIKKMPLTLDEFLFSLPKDKNSLILLDFINGLDLDDIQDKYDISRQNAKQIITKYHIPYVTEQEYLDLYNTYYFTLDEFCKIFQVDQKVYRYIELINTKPKGTRRIIEMLEDERVSINTKIRIQNTLGKYAFIEGKSILKKDIDILEIFSKTITKSISIDELETKFKNYWYELFHEELSYKANTFLNIVNESNSLINGKDGYRYYNINSLDIEAFYSNLNIKKYQNVELSTKLIFDTNKELMKSFDINDEFELYSILRKTYNKNNIEFNRKPIISINGGNRNNQIKTLLFELSPVSLNDFVKEYSNVYGVNEKSFSNYVTKTFSPYYQNQVFTIPFPEPSIDTINKIKEILNKDFYFISDIPNILYDNNIMFYDYYLNKTNLNKIGFSLGENYIYSNKYIDSKDYFNSLFGDILDVYKLDSRYLSIPTFINLLEDKCKTFEYIEYERNVYYSINKLNQMNISLELINDFIKNANTFVYEDDIFTIDYLINKGFSHLLLDYKLPKVFYSNILKYSKDLVYNKINYSNNYIFKLNKNNTISFIDLIEQIIEPKYYVYLNDIIKDLELIYGIVITEAKLLQFINKSNIYYNSDTNLYYLNYETYKKINSK